MQYRNLLWLYEEKLCFEELSSRNKEIMRSVDHLLIKSIDSGLDKSYKYNVNIANNLLCMVGVLKDMPRYEQVMMYKSMNSGLVMDLTKNSFVENMLERSGLPKSRMKNIDYDNNKVKGIVASIDL